LNQPLNYAILILSIIKFLIWNFFWFEIINFFSLIEFLEISFIRNISC
jgi:hypothetical protein